MRLKAVVYTTFRHRRTKVFFVKLNSYNSYSLLKFDQDFSNAATDWDDTHKLDEFLSFLSFDTQIKIITIRECYEIYQLNPDNL